MLFVGGAGRFWMITATLVLDSQKPEHKCSNMTFWHEAFANCLFVAFT
jgi:hypothetical protein